MMFQILMHAAYKNGDLVQTGVMLKRPTNKN